MTKDERDAIEWLLQKAEMAYLFAEGWHSRDDPLRRPGWIAELRSAHSQARAYFPHATLAPIEPPHDLPPPHAADELSLKSSE